MTEYTINLRPSQLRFLSDNFDALFFLDFHNPPEMSPERLARMKEYYWSVSEATRRHFKDSLGISNPSDPDLNKILGHEERYKAKEDFDLNSRSTSIVRSLYGVIGVERIQGNNLRCFHNFFVPEENWEATKEALNNGGTFSREFPDEDLDILRVISERNSELRELGIRHRQPFFYISEIADISGISMEDTERGLTNLTGVLGFCAQKEAYIWSHRWFVPRSREKLIEELLS